MKLLDHLRSSKWWMCARKWERIRSDDEYCESWVNGRIRRIIGRQDHGRSYCNMRRWVTQVCMVGMEVEESLVGDGNWSRAVLVSVSIQRWRREEVHRPCVRFGKWSRIRGGEGEEGANLRRKYKVCFFVWKEGK